MKEIETLSLKDWRKKGAQLFGKDIKDWKFKCPKCGEVQTLEDFIKQGVKEPEEYFHFSCIGRFDKSRGCDWTLGGLFQIHKTEVVDSEGGKHRVFEFAEQ